MKNWIIYLWFSVGIVVLVLSIFDFSAGIALREKTDSTTILSILITFLVAWQIWQTINFDSNFRSKLRREMTKTIEESTNTVLCVTFAQLGLSQYEKGDIEQAIRSLFNALNVDSVNTPLYNEAKFNAISTLKSIIESIEHAENEGRVKFDFTLEKEDINIYLKASLQTKDDVIIRFAKKFSPKE